MRQSVLSISLLVSICLISFNFTGLALAQEETTDSATAEEPVVVIVGDESETATPEAEAQLEDGEETKVKGKKTDEAAVETPEATTMAATATTTTGSDDETTIAPILVENAAFTGAANYTIPIKVPPGRAGMTPDIKLVYNSYLGNGWLGVGWSLDMGSIQRSTKFGLDYAGDGFVYVKDGMTEELVVRSEWGSDYYGAKIEGGFTKYYFNTATGGWEATSKDGRTYYFGSTADSRQDNASGVFKWCLDRVEDTNGNYMTLSYTKDQGAVYLQSVQYTGNSSMSPDRSVAFTLEDRTDTPPSYRTTSKVVIAKRLASISVAAIENPVSTYNMSYTDSLGSKRSLLTSVQRMGSDESPFPPINLEYEQITNGNWQSFSANPEISLVGSSYKNYIGDFNGDGRSDIVRASSTATNNKVLFADGTGGWTQIDTSPEALLFGSNKQTFVGDFNGDGKSDLLRAHSTTSNTDLLLSNGDGSWDTIAGATGVLLLGTNIKTFVGDFNGDGLTDLLRAYTTNIITQTTNNKLLLSNGDGTFDVQATTGVNFVASYLGRVQTYVGDFNGDGCTDLLRARRIHYIYGTTDNKLVFFYPDGSRDVISNTLTTELVLPGLVKTYVGDFNGDGRSDILRTMTVQGVVINNLYLSKGNGSWAGIGSTIPHDLLGTYTRLWIGDFNGDGMADILRGYINPLTLQVGNAIYLSKGAGNWTILGYNPETTLTNVNCGTMVADFNGDGRSDILRAYATASSNKLLLNMGGTSSTLPDYLIAAENGLGSRVELTYTPSSDFTNTLLPYVVHPVSSITVNDGLGNLSTTAYNYSGGLYDYATREFRGFETVTRTNPDGTIVETKYHQDEFRKGRIEQEGLWAAGSDPAADTALTITSNTWETEYLDAPANTTAFVKLSQTRTDYNDAVSVFTQQNFTYDSANGNPLTATVSGTGAENVTTTLTWQNYGDWLWRKTGETLSGATSGQVRQTTYEYENYTGNLTAEEKWLATGANPRVTYQYDAYGNVTHRTDARNNTTVIDYDTATATFPVKITYPATGGVSHIVEAGWDARYGKKTWDKDENGNVTTYACDPFGRMAQTDLPDGGRTTKTYFDDVVPRYTLTQVKENAAGTTIDKYRYLDGLNREVQAVAFGEGGQTIITQAFYDEMGRLSLKKGPFYGTGSGYPQTPPAEYPWQQIYYDNRSRPIAVESPHIQYGTIETGMAYSGFDTTVTDPDGGVKTESKDYLGRIVQVTEYNGVEQYHTDYAYNAAGDLTSVTDHLNNVTTVSWDTLGRKTAMDDPDMGAWSYTYDANGNLLTQTDAKNQVITFTYDELNRMTYKSYSTSDPAVAFLYDNTTAGKNGIGRLKSVESSQAVISYKAYDAVGRLLEESKQVIGNATVYTTSYAYDLSGKKIQTIHPDGTTVGNAFYPGTNLLNTVTGTGATTYATLSQYQPNGKIGRIDHGNAAVTTYSYDTWSEKLTGIVTQDYLDSEIQNRSYLYSRAGDIEEIDDAYNDVTYTYSYDDLHRLTGETNTGPEDPLFYTYNAIGNMISRGAGLVSVDYSYNPAHPHAVSSLDLFGTPFSYAYDANGNMTSGYDFTNPSSPALRTLAWNTDNMPVSVTRSGVTTSFTYDGLGQRAKKQVGSAAPTYYIGSEYEVIAGTGTKYIFAGNLRIAKVASTGVYYFHKDHLGSSTVMTGDTGAVVEASEYRPYGSFRSQTGTEVSDYKFTDQEWDAESGLYNYDARLYDPVIGRFISADNITQYKFDPQNLNRYSYCHNNPLIYTDPSGHEFNLGMSGSLANTDLTWSTSNPRELEVSITPGAIIGISAVGIYDIDSDSLPDYMSDTLRSFISSISMDTQINGAGVVIGYKNTINVTISADKYGNVTISGALGLGISTPGSVTTSTNRSIRMHDLPINVQMALSMGIDPSIEPTFGDDKDKTVNGLMGGYCGVGTYGMSPQEAQQARHGGYDRSDPNGGAGGGSSGRSENDHRGDGLH